jgi:hypothetical protein
MAALILSSCLLNDTIQAQSFSLLLRLSLANFWAILIITLFTLLM